MHTVKPLAPFQSLPRSTMREVVAGRILAAAIQGDFPAGHRLIVQRMAEQLGVSATPVREALFELAGIGIVDLLPNRGAVLREFGPRQLREIYQIRRVLEVEAVRTAFGRIDTVSLEAIKQELEQVAGMRQNSNWSERAMEIDVRFHALIANSSGSDRLLHELERYNTLMQVVREVVHNEQHAQDVAIGAHLEIIAELQFGTAESAAAAMAKHIDETAEIVGAAMFRIPQLPVSTFEDSLLADAPLLTTASRVTA